MSGFEEELAELAAELAEHLRVEHDAGAIGVPWIELAPVERGPGLPERRTDETPRREAVARPESAPSPSAPANVPTKASAPARPVATDAPDVDALLARARAARAPAKVAPREEPRVESVVAPPAPVGELVVDGRLKVLDELAREVASCTGCRLHESRTKPVFARGTPTAEVVFVGEGPGFNEDQKGEPFVGAAGQLLDKMIAAMGYSRDGVYICNVVKCRPPENRTPLPDESAACARFLDGQLGAIRPRVIVALGRCAAERLRSAEAGRGGWRGAWTEYEGVPVMATYHPAHLLRSPEMKRTAWEDLQKVMQRLGRTPGAGA